MNTKGFTKPPKNFKGGFGPDDPKSTGKYLYAGALMHWKKGYSHYESGWAFCSATLTNINYNICGIRVKGILR